MSRKRWIVAGAIVAGLLLLAGGAAYALRDDIAYAQVATGYAAKQTCSCVHVSGRSLDSCLGDFPEDARNQITVAPQGSRMRASVLFGVIHAEAEFEDGYGCRVLE